MIFFRTDNNNNNVSLFAGREHGVHDNQGERRQSFRDRERARNDFSPPLPQSFKGTRPIPIDDTRTSTERYKRGERGLGKASHLQSTLNSDRVILREIDRLLDVSVLFFSQFPR